MACLYPIEVDQGDGTTRKLPCGHCLPCRIKHSVDWQIRLRYELETWDYQALFLTLTYDDEHINYDAEHDCLPLVKSDLQKYIKRVRKVLSYDGRKCKYFACGEYGGSGVTTYKGIKYYQGRPHFHVILFGVTLDDVPMLHEEWQHDGYPEWRLGKNSPVGFVEEKSIGYVTNYCLKKQNASLNRQEYDYKNLPRPFQLSSQQLGLDGFMKEKDRIDKQKCIIFRGKPRGVPRYFKKKSDWDAAWNDEFISEMEALNTEALIERFHSARKLGYAEGLNNMSGSKKRQILADYIYSQSSTEKEYEHNFYKGRSNL